MSISAVAEPTVTRTVATSKPVVPRLVPGTRLLGRFEGSGLRDEGFLVRRNDGQMILLTPLLYQVAAQIDGRRSLEAVADAVTVASGRRLSTDNLEVLITTKLGPTGVVATSAAIGSKLDRADPLLALAGKRTLIGARVTGRVASFFAPLFTPVVLATWLLAFVAVEVWLFGFSGVVTSSMRAVMAGPELLLGLLALILVSLLFHELGHAAACRYGGGRPGAIGVGMYVIFPSFFTNVTDAYRLGRRDRLRTDLGGVYFNAIFVVVAGGLHATTGSPVFVAVIAITTFEMVQQLLPFVRLDGYFILCDLTGVPDLFARVQPTLRGLLRLGRGGQGFAELQPRVRRIVTIWIAVVLPLLVVGFAFLLYCVPTIVGDAFANLGARWSQLGTAWHQGAYPTVAVLAIFLVVLALPLLGLWLFAIRLVRQVARQIARFARSVARRHRSPVVPTPDPQEATPMTTSPDTSPSTSPDTSPVTSPGIPAHAWAPPVATAVAFTEETMLRQRARPPERGWRRIVYEATAGHVNVGPSRTELERRALVARVKAPVTGSRRVVVLCRKGGAGKTTTTLMLGHAFASSRGDRVVALDANPDAGSLAHRVRRETSQTVTSMLVDRGGLNRYADIRAYTSQAPTRLEVIASDDDPRISQRLGDQEYHHAISLLDRHYNLILVDTGTGILDAGIQGVLMEADQIVVVMPPALDGARVAAATLDWLDEHGHSALVGTAIAVINATRKQAFVELDRVEEHFGERCAAVVRIPWDPALAAGATTQLDDLRPATQLAYLELAAAVADQFHTASPRE